MRKRTKALKLDLPRDTVPVPPPDLGKLMCAEEVAFVIFDGQVTAGWVKRLTQL